MVDYELVIRNNIVDSVNIIECKKVSEFDITDIEDDYILTRIDQVNRLLKIHPLGESYILNNAEFQEYKDFIKNEKYKVKCDTNNPLRDRINKVLKNNK